MGGPADIFLPPDLAPARIRARLGIVSDTHMPERLSALPPALFTVLAGCDLLLHAGDVGELWVLDRLSAIAPVIAVHGNDDTADAQRELPYQQLLTIAGQRLFLYHSHYPALEEERAARLDDSWAPKLARVAARGQEAGASVVVFGHMHVPLAVRQAGVLLVNPGALASGGAVMRQRKQTVALLYLRDDGAPLVTHVDLANPLVPFSPLIDWSQGFRAAHREYGESILAPQLQARYDDLLVPVVPLAPREIRAAVLRVAHRCWAGQAEVITLADLQAEVAADQLLPAEVKARIANALRDMFSAA